MATPRRVVGRGRVIGKAASSTELLKVPEASPTGSSESLLSTSKSSTDDTDISAAISLQSSLPQTATSTRMICPICSEEMTTLLQLNRHLDDAHKNLEEEEQDEVMTWFKSQMVKAKRFQPLAVLNQKLKGLDVFEANEDRRSLASHQRQPSLPNVSTQPMPAQSMQSTLQSIQQPQREVIDTDELVSKSHWQRHTRTGVCSDPMCGKRLGPTNGNVNCRHCGKLFCEEHTMYQMKLSRSAQHEPVRGYWCRVCETCYKSRDGYNDHVPVVRDLYSDFAKFRRAATDKTALEVSRLEKRLTRLTQLLVDPRIQQEEQSMATYLRSFSGMKNSKRAAEESIVEWEDDSKVTHCPFCQQEFTSYTFRRHHCRLCGRVVCSDPTTDCSQNVPLDVASRTLILLLPKTVTTFVMFT